MGQIKITLIFRDLFSNIQSLENDSYIICGDFNLVLDPDLDYFNYKHVNNIKARDSILKIIDENNLFDAYRELHPSTKRYTWRRKNPLKQARLDFFLLTENLISTVKQTQIETGYRSDHSFITLVLAMDNFKRGKSLWKHNNSLLRDPEYLQTIRSKNLDIKTQHSLPIYNLENLEYIPDDKIQFLINDQLFL